MTPTPRALIAACLLCAVAVGCAREGGVVDGGEAPTLTPPPVAVPLWPSASPAWTPTTTGPPPGPAPLVVPVRPPESDSLRDVDAVRVLRADPAVRDAARASVVDCPDECGLRDPAYRDLTGDGREDLILAVDEPSGRTALFAYALLNGDVAHILGVEGLLYGIDTLGPDLVTHERVHAAADPQCCPSLAYTTRYHWNGREMAVVVQEAGGDGSCLRPGATGAPQPGPSAAGDPGPENP